MEPLNIPAERLLFRNEACMVINKLPGESSEFPDTGTDNRAGELFPVPVHRLDTPVSGCLLLARNPLAAAFLGAAFASPAKGKRPGEVEKRYWAITEKAREGNTFPPEGELIHWLRENKRTNRSFALPPDSLSGEQPGGLKKAVLRYRLIGQGDNYLFLEVDLVTGRHHQIRAQLAAMGLHVKGDLKYGARRSEKAGGIRLHAYSLGFPNPLNPDEKIRVKALPPLMDTLWLAFAEAAGVKQP